jgi:hypothetical protein
MRLLALTASGGAAVMLLAGALAVARPRGGAATSPPAPAPTQAVAGPRAEPVRTAVVVLPVVPPADTVVCMDSPPAPAVNRPARAEEKKLEVAELSVSKPAAKIVVRRRSDRTEEALIGQLLKAPEIALDRTAARAESAEVVAAAQRESAGGRKNHDATLALIDRRADFGLLPLRRGEACRLTPTAAACLEEGSVALRGKTSNADTLRQVLAGEEPGPAGWLTADAVPVLMQMLTAEGAAVREVLVEQMSRIEGKPATEALARLALFDLHPRVRERAIGALADRPGGDYQPVLLDGFEHPWAVVADHAAEALVALRRVDAVPALASLVERDDLGAPYQKADGDKSFVKELVRVSHLQNCLLCHPPSFDARDKVRGQLPRTESPGAYYQGGEGTFVRADITYLKQDFSALLPVGWKGGRPAGQRFDFIVREREALPSEVFESKLRKEVWPAPGQQGSGLLGRVKVRPYLTQGRAPREQQRSALFALRELTGCQ